jgi:predicted nuclease with RNAse H fold
VITVGVDLAAEPKNTAIAVLDWGATSCRISALTADVDDDAVVAATRGAAKVGLDCPLGWPDEFVAFVVAHRDGHVTVPPEVPGNVWRQPLANRLTDLAVRERLPGLVPMSVSADRIARPAMRAAALLSRLAADGHCVDRAGSGLVVEAYPAASLKRWGLLARSYKGPANLTALSGLAAVVLRQADWLDLGEHHDRFTTSDHCFDAVIAGLTARAAALGLTHPPGPAEAAAAGREGWIAVPSEPLERLRPGA